MKVMFAAELAAQPPGTVYSDVEEVTCEDWLDGVHPSYAEGLYLKGDTYNYTDGTLGWGAAELVAQPLMLAVTEEDEDNDKLPAGRALAVRTWLYVLREAESHTAFYVYEEADLKMLREALKGPAPRQEPSKLAPETWIRVSTGKRFVIDGKFGDKTWLRSLEGDGEIVTVDLLEAAIRNTYQRAPK